MKRLLLGPCILLALFQLPETNPPKLRPKAFTITTDRRQAR